MLQKDSIYKNLGGKEDTHIFVWNEAGLSVGRDLQTTHRKDTRVPLDYYYYNRRVEQGLLLLIMKHYLLQVYK